MKLTNEIYTQYDIDRLKDKLQFWRAAAITLGIGLAVMTWLATKT